ncbi:GPCPD1 [Bugula neritina]|uniref:GPCPD1 n=1 Tax=Bugula neritina TaxID=10212 RepID=A0A7J7IUX2_BUGNE|nr:GPCPD1 [Bugula neritina]
MLNTILALNTMMYQMLLKNITYSEYIDKLSPFPLLRDALREIDPNLGFYVEIKYPIYLYDNKSKEEGIESFFERNSFLDPILKVLHEEGGSRRIVIASFDPDTCIMARLKQNRYPVFFLVEDLGGSQPYFSDTRTHSVTSAVALAKSEKFLGVSINAAALMRKEDKLLEYVFAQQMICFVWGPDANNVEVRQDLKDRHVHAICHDEIGKNHRTSIYRAEHEDRIQKLATLYQSISPGLSPSHSLKGSAASLSTLESLEDSRSQLSLKAEKSNSSSYLLPTVTVTRDSATQSSSFHSTMQTDVTLNGQNATIQDYRTDFY